jgi:hypothetical protein
MKKILALGSLLAASALIMACTGSSSNNMNTYSSSGANNANMMNSGTYGNGAAAPDDTMFNENVEKTSAATSAPQP